MQKKSPAGHKEPKSKLKIQNVELTRDLLARISMYSKEAYDELNAVHKYFRKTTIKELTIYDSESKSQESLF